MFKVWDRVTRKEEDERKISFLPFNKPGFKKTTKNEQGGFKPGPNSGISRTLATRPH